MLATIWSRHISGKRKEVPDCDVLVLILDHRTAIVVHVQIVRRTEYRDHRWKLLPCRFAMHRVSSVLGLVPTENSQELIALQKLACGLVPV